MTPKLVFFSYGSSERWRPSMERLCDEAAKYGEFDEVLRMAQEDLEKDPVFWDRHKEFISKNHRGAGYWLWKSYITMTLLSSLNENDILVYMDAGCALWPTKAAKQRFREYVEIVRTHSTGVFGFSTEYPNKQWSKMDIFKHFNATSEEDLNKPQIMSGASLWRKCETSLKMATEWYETMAANYNLIDDTPSKEPNDPLFQENRHDQSILTMIFHKYGAPHTEKDELWDFRRNNYTRPFWAARLRYGQGLHPEYLQMLENEKLQEQQEQEQQKSQ